MAKPIEHTSASADENISYDYADAGKRQRALEFKNRILKMAER